MELREKKLIRIALTGGPCAGKTTALAYLAQRLGDAGFCPVFVPEAATILINAGIGPKAIGKIAFQQRVFELISKLEETIILGAHNLSQDRIVVIHDRGIPDARAYVTDEEFDSLLVSWESNMPAIRDERYDAVFHLRTAAFGAEHFYTDATNRARYENIGEAREVDEKILRAWVGHPHLRIIDNSTPFQEKLERLYKEVCVVLGIPVPLEIERKFLVRPFDIETHVSVFQKIDIEQLYIKLTPEGEEVRVRKRGQFGSFVYYRAEKRLVAKGVRSEREEQVERALYERLSLQRLVGTRVIKKTRTCFVYKDQYFEYDQFLDPPNLHLLEIELTGLNDRVDIPPFVDVLEEVTASTTYSNACLAQYGGAYERH